MSAFRLLSLCVAVLLAGCDLFGTEAAEKLAANREADGKAVGSACRHAGRAIEDCYQLNPKAQRAAVFAGWREMDEYMRENKIEAVPPAMERLASAAPDTAKPEPAKLEPPKTEPAKTELPRAEPVKADALLPGIEPKLSAKPRIKHS